MVAQRSFISWWRTWRRPTSWNLLNLELALAQFVAGWLPSPWERRKWSESQVLALLFHPTCSSSMWGLAFSLPGLRWEPQVLNFILVSLIAVWVVGEYVPHWCPVFPHFSHFLLYFLASKGHSCRRGLYWSESGMNLINDSYEGRTWTHSLLQVFL